MPKKITLKLVGIRYDGVSIGNDIRIEVDVFDKTVAYDVKLKRGENVKPNLELGSTTIEKKPFEISTVIRVIERDVLFPDKGQETAKLKIDPKATFPQRFTHLVTVRESRGFLTKRNARFEITIEARSPRFDNAPPVLEGRIALYPDIEQAREVNLRKSAKITSPILATLKNGESIEIIERIVEGEYVENKSNIWHKVRHMGKIGYILSSFVEIAGEERTSVIALIQKYARTHGADEHMAVSFAGCESRYKPCAVSFSGARGIFQLTGIARKDLVRRYNFRIGDNETFDIRKNIEGGILHLKGLVDDYRGTADFKKKVIAAWNAGKSLIPIKGRLDLSLIPTVQKRKEAEKLISCVLKNQERKDWRLIMPIVIVGLFLSAIVSLAFAGGQKFFSTDRQFQKESSLHFAFYRTPHDLLGPVLVYSVSDEPFTATSSIHYSIDREKRGMDLRGFPVNAYFLGNQPFNDFLVIAREEGQQIITSLLRYDADTRDLVLVPFINTDGSATTELCCSYITHVPKNYGFAYDIILYDFHRYTSLPPTKTTYQYSGDTKAFVALKE